MSLPRTPLPITLAACVVAFLPGCGEPSAADGPLQVERDSVGDTVLVHVLRGSIWEKPARLQEDLRIGSLEGNDDAKIFGEVTEMAVDSAGGIYAFDAQAPALRYYDAAGRYVRTLGRKGHGPGEYENRVRGLVVAPGGRVLLRDMSNARISLYDGGTGAFVEQWVNPGGLYTGQALGVDTAGDAYVKVLAERLDPRHMPTPWPIGLAHLDRRGALVDTVRPWLSPRPGDGDGGWPRVWDRSPLGDIVEVFGTAYAFEIHRPDGQVVRVRRDVPVVRLTDAEVTALESRGYHGVDREVAAIKTIYFDASGSIWICHAEPAVPSDPIPLGPPAASLPDWPFYEPVVFDVYRPDGTYLGEVRLPKAVRPFVVSTSAIYGVAAGKYDEEYLVRYRVATG